MSGPGTFFQVAVAEYLSHHDPRSRPDTVAHDTSQVSDNIDDGVSRNRIIAQMAYDGGIYGKSNGPYEVIADSGHGHGDKVFLQCSVLLKHGLKRERHTRL